MRSTLRNMGIFAFILSCSFLCLGQEDDNLKGNGTYLGVFYGVHWPGGDMGDRFGNNFSLGANVEFIKSEKWVFGLEGQFLFGDNVKENVFGGLVTANGNIIGTNYLLADIEIKERGINIFGKFGRIHDLWSDNSISGIKWTVGAGFFQHKIKLAEAQGNVPFFEDNYVAGYDRLSNGFGLSEFIGYQYLDGRGRLNFFVGGELTQAFTKNRRKLNYDTRATVDDSAFDLLFGLQVGVQITIRRFKSPDEIWY